MTEERKKYLAGISKEEQAIRYAIKCQRDVISNCKSDLTRPWLFSAPNNILKLQISDAKAIIKVLKKQLPAPILKNEQLYFVGTMTVYYCPVCYMDIGRKPKYGCYCKYCGQKLR